MKRAMDRTGRDGRSFQMKRAIARVAMRPWRGRWSSGRTAAQAGVIKVGITLHMVTETGQKMGQMILDEFEEQNRLGGINGHRLEPILLNDECKSDKGVANMTRLVHQDQVHVVIGSTCSGVTLASMGIATKAEVPQITPHSSNATITMQGSEWIFRASISGRYSRHRQPHLHRGARRHQHRLRIWQRCGLGRIHRRNSRLS